MYILSPILQLLLASERARFYTRAPPPSPSPPNFCSVAQILTICQLVWIIHSSHIFVIFADKSKDPSRALPVSGSFGEPSRSPSAEKWRCRMQNAMSCSLLQRALWHSPTGTLLGLPPPIELSPSQLAPERREPPTRTSLISANTAARGDTAAQTLNRSIHDAQVTWNSPLLTLFDLYALIPARWSP